MSYLLKLFFSDQRAQEDIAIGALRKALVVHQQNLSLAKVFTYAPLDRSYLSAFFLTFLRAVCYVVLFSVGHENNPLFASGGQEHVGCGQND